jgi:uncharacterized protein
VPTGEVKRMSDSLRDQLLKAGLVTKEQVAKAEKKHPHNPRKNREVSPSQSRPAVAASPPPPKPAPVAAIAPDAAQKKAEKERVRALRGEVRTLLNAQRLNQKEAAEAYRFMVGTHIKQVYVTAEQRAAMQQGTLAVVLFDARCQIVGLDTAHRVRELMAVVPVHIATEAQTSGDLESGDAVDDEYADYKVPDDFIW